MSLSFFDILNQGNVAFDVDLKRVRKEYLELQRRLHPDQFQGTLDKMSTTLASDWSAFVNQGYKVLTSPLHRAIYTVPTQSLLLL
jgi:molecular chaperone HscB